MLDDRPQSSKMERIHDNGFSKESVYPADSEPQPPDWLYYDRKVNFNS